MTTAAATTESALGPVARAGLRLADNDRLPLDISFEFSPPKTPEMEVTLWECIHRLEPLNPSFVSVTYGAGGSTRERTHRTVKRILDETTLKPAAHLTCVNASRGEIDDIVRDYWGAGIRHLVAIRGDPPGSIGGVYIPRSDGYANATELTRGIARIAPFEISVSLYPQKHPESPSLAYEIDVLKAKIDAGATRAISQFFFDIDSFLRFADQIRKAGVTIPILPGIMPVTDFRGLQTMAERCGIPLPDWLGALFDGLERDPGTRKLISCSVAAEMCARLAEEGYGDLHFYTSNRADLTYAICRVLGVRKAVQ